jgi:hypothetical protein
VVERSDTTGKRTKGFASRQGCQPGEQRLRLAMLASLPGFEETGPEPVVSLRSTTG